MRLFTAVAIASLCLLAHRAAAADEFPKGKFVLKTPDGSEWAVTFDDKGKFTAMLNGELGVKGAYKVTKDEIEFTDEDGPFAGKGEEQKATYKWKLDGKKLTFTKVKDSSEGRAAVVTGGAWEKKE
ncbi:MAG TPA: hypothetical protein VKD90_25980 [Gemmataceae bacterium]|nr:hypothetical protein [Gemmataceae bacterium]